MGTSGVPFNIPKKRIIESIKKKKGVVSQICDDLDICYDTYSKHIKTNPEYKDAIDSARNNFDTTICDMAETALMRALNQVEDMSASLSSAKFVLNNKGKNRGYSPIQNQPSNSDIQVNDVLRGIKEIFVDEGSESSGQSGMEAQQPVSDSKPRRVDKVSPKRGTKKRL